MSNTINNIPFQSTAAVSSYDVQPHGELKEIGMMHQLCRNIADTFRNMSSTGRMHIAQRNGQVAAKMCETLENFHASIKNLPNSADLQKNTLQKLQATACSYMESVKKEISEGSFSAEKKEIYTNHLFNLSEVSQLSLSKKVSALKMFHMLLNKQTDFKNNSTANENLKTFINKTLSNELLKTGNYSNEDIVKLHAKDLIRNRPTLGTMKFEHDGAEGVLAQGENHEDFELVQNIKQDNPEFSKEKLSAHYAEHKFLDFLGNDASYKDLIYFLTSQSGMDLYVLGDALNDVFPGISFDSGTFSPAVHNIAYSVKDDGSDIVVTFTGNLDISSPPIVNIFTQKITAQAVIPRGQDSGGQLPFIPDFKVNLSMQQD